MGRANEFELIPPISWITSVFNKHHRTTMPNFLMISGWMIFAEGPWGLWNQRSKVQNDKLIKLHTQPLERSFSDLPKRHSFGGFVAFVQKKHVLLVDFKGNQNFWHSIDTMSCTYLDMYMSKLTWTIWPNWALKIHPAAFFLPPISCEIKSAARCVKTRHVKTCCSHRHLSRV